MHLKLNDKFVASGFSDGEISAMKCKAEAALKTTLEKSGAGSDFLGWVTLPADYDRDEFARIEKAAKKINSDSDYLVVIGIGGSYLGAKSAIDFLPSANCSKTKVIFAGNNLSADYLNAVIAEIDGKDFSINVISKSGTTTEPAIAFRIFRKLLTDKYGDKANERIYATTDKARGTLKALAEKEGWETFVVPDDVGGRYSVLTAVGLLPIAVAGADIQKIMLGAKTARDELTALPFESNACLKYAAYRNLLLNGGKTIEVLSSFEPTLAAFAEWFKQLYGESEGKDGKGIFPASVCFTTDLHSLGQYIQDGIRNIFETVLWVENPTSSLSVPFDDNDGDGLNFLSGKDVNEINKKAHLGTVLAHVDGGVPNIIISLDRQSEECYGYAVYFFELACAVSGYILGVNPFNQPGVEDYKKNMFALMGKKGYEDRAEQLLKRLV